jgi:hypothetical protein
MDTWVVQQVSFWFTVYEVRSQPPHTHSPLARTILVRFCFVPQHVHATIPTPFRYPPSLTSCVFLFDVLSTYQKKPNELYGHNLSCVSLDPTRSHCGPGDCVRLGCIHAGPGRRRLGVVDAGLAGGGTVGRTHVSGNGLASDLARLGSPSSANPSRTHSPVRVWSRGLARGHGTLQRRDPASARRRAPAILNVSTNLHVLSNERTWATDETRHGFVGWSLFLL